MRKAVAPKIRIVKSAFKWSEMAGETPLEKMMNAFLTTEFIQNHSVPDDECLNAARKVIEIVRAYGESADPGAAWDALGREKFK